MLNNPAASFSVKPPQAIEPVMGGPGTKRTDMNYAYEQGGPMAGGLANYNTQTATPAPGAPGSAYTPQPYVIQNRDPTASPTENTDYAGQLANYVDSFADPNNILNKRAEAAGLAQANSRGLLNSSMAVQSAQNAVLDRASDLGKTAYAGWNQNNQAKQQNWLNQESYNRDYVGTLAALPIKTYNDSLNALMQAAIDDPSLMDPDAMSGFANFFQQMSQNMFSNYKYADGTPISGAGGA